MYETETVSVGHEPRTIEPECAPQVECLEFSVNVQAFKAFVSELVVLADECKIKIDPVEGLTVRLVDPQHIAMTQTGIAKEVCESWRVLPSSAYVGSFGVDLVKLKVYLKAFKVKDKDEILHIKVDMDKRQMSIEGPTGSRVISLIDDTGMSDHKLPNLDLPTELVIKDAKMFRGAMKMASEISDHISMRFDASEKVLWLECEGEYDKMASKLDVEVIKSEASIIFQLVDGISKRIQTQDTMSLFPLEYLEKMAQGLPDGFKVKLGMDYPLVIVSGQTIKMLAPRIESSD